MPRIFVSIDLPPTVKGELAAISSRLPGARWVQGAQIHLTLRFIGEVEDDMFGDILQGLAGIKSSAFAMRLAGVGGFPPGRHPRILWAGVEPLDPVVELHGRVESALVNLGLAPEGRSFSPHVTLARLRYTPAAKVTRYLADNAFFLSTGFEVQAFHLYSSILSRNGAIHQIEADYPLS